MKIGIIKEFENGSPYLESLNIGWGDKVALQQDANKAACTLVDNSFKHAGELFACVGRDVHKLIVHTVAHKVVHSFAEKGIVKDALGCFVILLGKHRLLGTKGRSLG